MLPPPGSMSYSNPTEIYSGASGPSQVGFGSNGPPSSFSAPSGHSSGPSGTPGNPGPYGSYGYNYGFVPQVYPPYNPNSV